MDALWHASRAIEELIEDLARELARKDLADHARTITLRHVQDVVALLVLKPIDAERRQQQGTRFHPLLLAGHEAIACAAGIETVSAAATYRPPPVNPTAPPTRFTDLPPDLADAFEGLRYAIACHRRAHWSQVPHEKVMHALGGLTHEALRLD